MQLFLFAAWAFGVTIVLVSDNPDMVRYTAWMSGFLGVSLLPDFLYYADWYN